MLNSAKRNSIVCHKLEKVVHRFQILTRIRYLPLKRLLEFSADNNFRSLMLFLTVNAPIATKIVCFSRLLKCLRSLFGKQCEPRSDCSYPGSTLFASILNSSVMLGNNLQQITSADDIFRFLGALRVNNLIRLLIIHVKGMLGRRFT